MKQYRITHTTHYTYRNPVTSSYGTYLLRPRELPWQRLLHHDVTVAPLPEDVAVHTDVYGNRRTYFHVTTDHLELDITSVSQIQIGAYPQQSPGPALEQPWESCRPRGRPEAWQELEFALSSPMAPISDLVTQYAAPSVAPGRPIAEVVTDLMHRIHDDFTYDPDATTVHTTVDEALTLRRGVCQDFSHLMVAALRSAGLAAKYVSGYLATRPPPGKPRLVGADATHAWVGCWVPDFGWLYVDPTNNRWCDESHAVVAWGRDYGDVAPVRGVLFSSGSGSELSVSVDMAPVEVSSDDAS